MPKPLIAAFVVFLLAIGAVFGFMVGGNKSQARWYQMPATVSVEEQKATFQGDGHTFSVSESVAWWDTDGTFHESGWPECLTERTTSVRFLSTPHPIDYDGMGIRPVLAVDCQK